MVVSGSFMSGVVVLSAILRWKLTRMNKSQSARPAYEMASLDRNGGSPPQDQDEEAEGLMEESGGASRRTPQELKFEYML
jgi:hypothetical protein